MTYCRYRARVKFQSNENRLFGNMEKDAIEDFNGALKIRLKARDAYQIAEATQFHVDLLSFEKHEDALIAARRLRKSLQLANIAYGLGLSFPEDEIVQDAGDVAPTTVRLLQTKAGIVITPDTEQHGEELVVPRIQSHKFDFSLFSSYVAKLYSCNPNLPETNDRTLALLTASAKEQSPTASFLMAYLALEQCMPDRDAEPALVRFLEVVEAFVERAPAPTKEIDRAVRIKSLVVKAIRGVSYVPKSSLIIAWGKMNHDLKLGNQTFASFLDRCVKMRNKIAHGGSLDKIGDPTLMAGNLRQVIVKMLWDEAGLGEIPQIEPQPFHITGVELVIDAD